MRIAISGATLNYEIEGPEDAPVLAFSNSLAASLAMWDPQVARLRDRYRILRYDNRGHGASPPTPGPYTIGLLASDLLDLLDALDIEKVQFCGLSKGGMVGQWIGINAPGRVERLVLANTTSYFPNKEMWRERMDVAANEGIGAVAEAAIKRWFTPGYLARPGNAPVIDEVRRIINQTTPEGYLAASVAIRDMDFREELPKIELPTLVIVGEKDPATLPEFGELIVSKVPNARLAVIRDAAHLSNIEQADAFTSILDEFMTG